MAIMDTTYGNGGVTTKTSGTPQFQLPDNSEMMRLAYEIARRRVAANRAPAAPRLASAGPRMSPADYATPSPWGVGPSGIDSELANAEKRSRIIDLEQANRPAPQRMVSGPGVTPGYVSNPNAMDASQRQAYLPSSSSFYDPEAEGRAKAKYEAEQRSGQQTSSQGRAAAEQGRNPQEQRIAELQRMGFTNPEIAQILGGR
jgi:hypothetical protein